MLYSSQMFNFNAVRIRDNFLSTEMRSLLLGSAASMPVVIVAIAALKSLEVNTSYDSVRYIANNALEILDTEDQQELRQETQTTASPLHGVYCVLVTV